MTSSAAYDDRLRHFFAEVAGESPYNRYTDRPSNLALIGDCADQRILDIGCGAGHIHREIRHWGGVRVAKQNGLWEGENE